MAAPPPGIAAPRPQFGRARLGRQRGEATAAVHTMSHDHAVPDAVDVPVLALDARGVVRGVNAAFGAASGLARERVLHQPFADLCPRDDAEQDAALQRLAEALRARQSVDTLPLLLRDARGDAWPVRVSLRPVDAGAWLTLHDRRESLRAEHLAEMLDLAQQFGRL